MAGLIDGLSYNQQLELIYIAYFNRAGDANGFNFWNGQNIQAQAKGGNPDSVLKGIADSFTPQPETYALYPFLSTPNLDLTTASSQVAIGAVVDAIYHNLFNRVADAAGRAYWVTNISDGVTPLGEAVLYIANGAIGADAVTVQNKITVALDFTNRTEAAYQSYVAPPAPYLSAAKSVLGNVDGAAPGDASVTAGIAATSSFLDTSPTISGTAAVQPTTQSAAVTPFASVQIADPDAGASETVTITETAGGSPSDADGVLSGAGLTHTGTGTYTLAAGSPAAVTAQLQGLVFTPTANQSAPGSAVTTGFTLSVSDGIATPPTTDATTSVVAKNTQPTSTTTTLTLLQDNPPASGAGGDVINAPLLFNAATATQITTLQTGDTITETGLGNTLNLSVGSGDKTITGALISGVQTLNVTNTGLAGTPVLAGAGISGLTTVNNVNSSQAVAIGTATSPLAAALGGAGLSSTTSSPNLTGLTVLEAAAALAGTTDMLAVAATNAGTATTIDRVLVGPTTGVNGYETETVTATGADFIGIGNPFAGANTTAKLAVGGAGTVSVFGDGLGNDFQSLSTIDASGSMGAVTITGASTAGIGVGLLTGDTALASVLGGSAGDSVDISAMTPAQLTANHTAIDLGGGRNTLIVSDAVAVSTSLAGAKNVQILGDANPGSSTAAIDLSMLPASIDTVQLFGALAGPVKIVNGPTAFTYNQSTFGAIAGSPVATIAAAGTGLADTLTIIDGSATVGNTTAGYDTVTGYENVNLQAQGTTQDTLFQVTATASAGGSETLTISGSTPLTILGPVTGSAIVLSGNNTTIVDTDTAVLVLATAFNTGSTDANTINAANSGGLIMGGAETGNHGVSGQAIIGSAVAGKSNILIGSPGNDSMTGGIATDVIVTDGGADTINLGTTHTTDRVEVYGVDNTKTVQPVNGSPVSAQGAATGSIVNAADQAQAGFWGVVPGSGAAPINLFLVFPGNTATNYGTSADMATVSHFIGGTAGDVVDFSLSSFSAATATHKGLTAVDGKTAAAAGQDVQIVQAQSGGVLSGFTADLVVLTGGTFASANALAAALKSGSYALSLSAATQAGVVNHMMLAYNDTAGNTRIADVAINQATTAGGSLSAQTNIAAQDLVQLVGVSDSSLTSNNIHIVT